MKIGKATVRESAICTSDDERIVVRGRDLCRELIGRGTRAWPACSRWRPGPGRPAAS